MSEIEHLVTSGLISLRSGLPAGQIGSNQEIVSLEGRPSVDDAFRQSEACMSGFKKVLCNID